MSQAHSVELADLMEHEKVIEQGLGTFCESARLLREKRQAMSPPAWADYCVNTLRAPAATVDDMIELAVTL